MMRMKWGSPLSTGAPLETSAWDCVSEAKTFNAGFRLVHDGVDRVERGGSCLLDSFQVGQARGYRVNPAFPSAARGFRLARAEM